MKKIMFIQNEAHVLGGIFQVNKTLANEFNKLKYDVQIVSIRNNHPDDFEKTTFKQYVLNEKDKWSFITRRDVVNAIKKFNKPLKTFLNYLKDYIGLQKDYKHLKKYISNEKPDYIIASHYQVLDGIPSNLLNRVVYVQHSTFNAVCMDKKNLKTLKRFNHKIFGISWLCNSTKKEAEKSGLINNYFIYNPVRFSCAERADVKKNKKLVALTRFSPEKRIDLMVQMVNRVFNTGDFNDWTFELYGSGTLDNNTLAIIKKNSQIKIMGVVSEPKNVLLKSSCILNTSTIEGFPLSIIEAFNCGVPAISFKFGEAASEQITDDVDGFVVEQDNVEKYEKKLKYLMENLDRLDEFGKNVKKSSEKFESSTVASEWIKLFREMDDENDKS